MSCFAKIAHQKKQKQARSAWERTAYTAALDDTVRLVASCWH